MNILVCNSHSMFSLVFSKSFCYLRFFFRYKSLISELIRSSRYLSGCSLNYVGTTIATMNVFHCRFHTFENTTLLTSLLAAFIPLNGTTFDKGLDGLGKVDSHLKYFSIATYVHYVLNATWHNFAVSLAITFGQKFSRIRFLRKTKKPLKSSKIEALEIFRLYGNVYKKRLL